MMILLLISLLLFKHYIADFILQTDYQFKHKRTYGHFGGILHALIHTTGTFLVLVFFSWKFALIAALADGVIHYHVDWLKSNTTHHFKLSPANRSFWYIFGLDQLIHQMTYLVIVFIYIR